MTDKHESGSNIDVGNEQQAFVALEADITKHYSRLEIESIWLFLATLGCWSVTIPLLQVVAYIITFIIFGNKIGVRWKNEGSFPMRLSTIQGRLDKAFEDSNRREALIQDCYDLRERISITKSPSQTRIFIAISTFYVVSFCCCFGKYFNFIK
jgi:hypothetical protein